MEKSYGKILFLAATVALLGWAAMARAGGEYAGSDTCATCHEEVAKSFRMTAHAGAPGWDAEKGCEACHGPGAAHVDGEGDLAEIVRLKELAPGESSRICLECHTRQEANFKHRSSIHGLADVGCIDCHDPHNRAEKQLRKDGPALCADCHQIVVSQFDLPRSHPLPPKGRSCVTCHAPHGATSQRVLEGFGNITCGECHFEKAGPFLYSHDVALVDGCQACHSIHGTSNRHLLKHERQINLCYQCHPGTTTPAFHSATNWLNEKCTACHTAIHGSNTNALYLEE